MTFAHIETGYALDPRDDASQADYEARYNPEIMGGWNIAQVPDGTLHGAKDNGDGTFTNPILGIMTE